MPILSRGRGHPVNITTEISVPTDGTYFEGHFPGMPVLPGVATIVMMLEALERKTCSPFLLRGISYIRLRRIVVPGDHLDVAATILEGGRLRTEVKRTGALVSNAEFIIGSPVPSDMAPPSTPQASRPFMAIPPLDLLLPHRPPMRFVNSVLSRTESNITCSASIPSACPLTTDGSAPVIAGIEAAAQAAAAWETLQRRDAEGAPSPRVGYLVALRDIDFFTQRIPTDRPLLVMAAQEGVAPPLRYYQIALYLESTPLIRGMIGTVLKDEGAPHDSSLM